MVHIKPVKARSMEKNGGACESMPAAPHEMENGMSEQESFIAGSEGMNTPGQSGTGTTDITVKVRAFYDHYPYPSPTGNLKQYGLWWQDRNRRRADHHLFWPAEPYREDRSILVAGCGTSQAAKYALRWPAGHVTGIDISSTSVQVTEGLKRKYSLNNLTVCQLAVEDAGELGLGFDQIVCTGVLHHLADPDQGLAALRRVLKPGGAMHIMVYAPYGRAGVYMLQEYCRRLGIGTAEREIRDLASTLSALPRDHPLANLLQTAPDFRNQAGLADALLHPRDRSYSVPQLLDYIHKGGLAFGRWLRQAPYLPQCGAIAGTPHVALLARLPAAEQFAAVELFRGTMARHSAIIYHHDQADESLAIRFDGRDWPSYVPIRTPRTICVQEKLPPGAAAVLINQDHTFTDLYLPVDAQEKQWFDSIDGNRTIEEIMNRTDAHNHDPGHTRTFFQRLWQYDQVVFDASSLAETTIPVNLRKRKSRKEPLVSH